MLVKLKVNQSTFEDIWRRVQEAGQSDRASFTLDGVAIDLSGIAIVVDKENPDRGK